MVQARQSSSLRRTTAQVEEWTDRHRPAPERSAVQRRGNSKRFERHHRAESQPLHAASRSSARSDIPNAPVESGERLSATHRAVRARESERSTGAVRVQRPAEVEENQSSHSDNDPQRGDGHRSKRPRQLPQDDFLSKDGLRQGDRAKRCNFAKMAVVPQP